MQSGMVHALREIHRILKPNGKLIDLRPHIDNRQLWVELASATLFAGEIDSSATVNDHLVADRALQKVIDDGLLTLEHQTEFELFTDLDTVDDLLDYRNSLRSSILPDDVVQQVSNLTADETDDYRIRIRRMLTIARYRKCSHEL